MVGVVFKSCDVSISCWVVDCRYSFSTVLIHLVETGRVYPFLWCYHFQCMATLQLKFCPFELCSCRAHRVFCFCNAWLWGQLSFLDACTITWEVVGNVNSCGRRCSLNVIENVVPRWFCRVSRYTFQQYFECDEPFLGQQSSFSDPV